MANSRRDAREQTPADAPVVPVEAAKGCHGGNSGQQSRTFRYQKQIGFIASQKATTMSENKKATDTPLYYPRKMRTGWCVAHEVTAAGVTIERYGIRCQTYAEAFGRAEVMNREQADALQPAAPDGEKGGERS